MDDIKFRACERAALLLLVQVAANGKAEWYKYLLVKPPARPPTRGKVLTAGTSEYSYLKKKKTQQLLPLETDGVGRCPE